MPEDTKEEKVYRDIVHLSMGELRKWSTKELQKLSPNRNINRELARREKRRKRIEV